MPKRESNWLDLLCCALRGHPTFLPEGQGAEELVARITVQSSELGLLIQCPRCENFVAGPPKFHGGLDKARIHAQTVLRGKALRQSLILKAFAIERVLRVVGLVAVAWGLWEFHKYQAAIQKVFANDWPVISNTLVQIHVTGDTSTLGDAIQRLLSSNPHTLALSIAALLGYAGIEAVEAVGLWIGQRWGEVYAFFATAIFLVPEFYEIVKGPTSTKVVLFAINIGLVAWLLYAKRLFGIRGGRSALEASFRADSILEPSPTAAAKPA